MNEPRKKAGCLQDILNIIAFFAVLLLGFQHTADMRYLYAAVEKQGQTIALLLQAENERLTRELAQQAIETLPMEAGDAFCIQPPVFKPLDIELSEDIQLTVWELCGEYPTFLSQQELFELVLKVMWNECGHQVNAPDNHNTNGTIDRGPMQINSVNWGWLADEGLDINRTEDNIEAGVRILSDYLNQYQDIEYALTAYGNGPAGAHALGGRSETATRIINLDLEEVA